MGPISRVGDALPGRPYRPDLPDLPTHPTYPTYQTYLTYPTLWLGPALIAALLTLPTAGPSARAQTGPAIGIDRASIAANRRAGAVTKGQCGRHDAMKK